MSSVSPGSSSQLLWSSEMLQLHLDPITYLSTLTHDACSNLILDLLQQLWLDTVTPHTKCLLLNIIDEHCPLLLLDDDTVQQTVGSLIQFFHSTATTADNTLSVQIIITVTSVLVQQDVICGDSRDVFCQFIDTLLIIVSGLNVPSTCMLRDTACSCLQELETCYPGILQSKLEHYYQMCHFEHTSSYQSYALMFANALHHTIIDTAHWLTDMSQSTNSKQDKPVNTEYFTQLLVQRTESLTPVTITNEMSRVDGNKLKQFSPMAHLTRVGLTGDVVISSGDVNLVELKNSVSFLLNNSDVLTPESTCRLLYILLDIVRACPGLQRGNVFKSSIIRHLPTLCPALSQCVLHMLGGVAAIDKGMAPTNSEVAATDSGMSVRDDEAVVSRVTLLASHPSLTAAHRLIYTTWLYHLLPSCGECDSVYPRVFDGVDTQLAKLSLLIRRRLGAAKLEPPSIFLQSLYKPLLTHGLPGRLATALYRALYTMYRDGEQDGVIGVLVTLIETHPQLSQHTINFLNTTNASSTGTGKAFTHMVLEEIMNFVDKIPSSYLLPYMKLMHRATQDESINTKKFIHFMKRLFKYVASTRNSNSGMIWSVGNDIMLLCRQIMLYHNTDSVYQEFSDFLFEVMTCEYEEVGPVDWSVRDHAKFYYSLLMQVSGEKIRSILSLSYTDNNNHSPAASNKLATFVTGNANFTNAKPMIELSYPVVEVVPLDTPISVRYPAARDTDDGLSRDNPRDSGRCRSDAELLDLYRRHISSPDHCDTSVIKQFAVSLLPTDIQGEGEMDVIYALDIEFSVGTASVYSPIEHVSIGRCRHGESHVISVTIKPLLPLPNKLCITVTFTTTSGSVYTCNLPAVHINLDDLFLPIPAPMDLAAARHQLITALWKHIQRTESAVGQQEFVRSICCPPIEWNRFQEISEGRLAAFRLQDKGHTTSVRGDGGDRYSIFLPPSHHLLLDAAIGANETEPRSQTNLTIYTDSIHLLPFINEYLHKITTTLT